MKWSARPQLITGFIALAVLVIGIGGWSVMTHLSGAVIASGQVVVEDNRQVVQHAEGGIVGEILVRDGDLVNAGDMLIKLDATLLRSELDSVEGQLFELVARRDRLAAERDEADEITFSDLLDEANADDAAQLKESQIALFEARRESLRNQREQLVERKGQLATQIAGSEAQLNAITEQLGFIREELEDQESLFDRGLTQQSRVLSLQRERAGLQGQIGELTSSIAGINGQITELDIEILRLGTQRREEAITELRNQQGQEIDLSERRLSLRERLARLDIRAPSSGLVYGMEVHAENAVIQAAEPLMYIVPSESPLIVESRVESIHIDQVHIGQPASMRFSAFDQRTTPEIFGAVVNVSADVFTDERTGESFYTAKILPNDGELDKLEGLTLVPGMPVESFIRTNERTPLSYLVKPMADYFAKAFREPT
ncbi:HlyD family type I secretion periplasmic adaptor subunit [Paracoccaceae bacterium GXU_MW_L88]